MQRTAEAVSLGHPDKIADYISSYILDRLIEQDPHTRYAVEVMIKDNTVVLGGEVTTSALLGDLTTYVKSALSDIGYDERYASIWGNYAIDPAQIKVINMIGVQSADIAQGVDHDGWGDQGVFVGYAAQGEGKINRELFLARKLNKALYEKARTSDNLGLDIKTQITLNDDKIETAIVAIPMLHDEDLTDFVISVLGEKPAHIIVNGTGRYTYHSSIADCGITGRKLACDFYSTAAPIGGGSPWTKDASKADLTLNVYARILACENLADNDECFVYLSSCIGRAELPSGLIKTIKNGIVSYRDLWCNQKPSVLIKAYGLDKPIYAKLCDKSISGILPDVK
ncbi:MAG: methionine adenosyltransferase domain-containing protein [Alphaproteobacteria bacterium]|nr:methionine adenosyltransferase domain-containing protein [Alphaproteobacteria bacterium]